MSEKYDRYCHFIFICGDKDCKKAGAKELKKEFEYLLKRKHLHKITKVITCDCTDRCKEAPVAIIDSHWHGNVSPKLVNEIIDRYISE